MPHDPHLSVLLADEGEVFLADLEGAVDARRALGGLGQGQRDGAVPLDESDDGDADVNPGATEVCYGIDNDCDGGADEEDAADVATWYADGDGFGDAAVPEVACDQPSGYVADDSDCDGLVDDADPDLPADGDNDGVSHCEDCDDDANVYGGAAGVIDVPADHATIQDAIDAAAAGEVICVAAGTYYESINFNGKAVTVTGSRSAVIDGGGSHLGVYIGSGEGPDTVLKGVTVTHAEGGIYIRYSSPTLIDLTVADNTYWGSGAGITVYDDSHPTITGGVIERNSGIYLAYGDPTFTNITVVGNQQSGSGACGGGIASDWNAVAVLDNIIVHANEFGAGASVGGICDCNGTMTIKYCNVHGNDGADYFGADLEGVMGNISEDPEFLDTSSPDALDWDLHLDTISDCVGAGDLTISDPDGSRSDMGTYGGPDAEFYALDLDGFHEWWQPGAYDHVGYPALDWDCDDLDGETFPGNGC